MAVRLSVSRTGRYLLTRRNRYFCLLYSFLLEAEQILGPRATASIRSIDKIKLNHQA
jgi:hypothetical protein